MMRIYQKLYYYKMVISSDSLHRLSPSEDCEWHFERLQLYHYFPAVKYFPNDISITLLIVQLIRHLITVNK